MSTKTGKKKWIIIVAIVVVLALVIGVVAIQATNAKEPVVAGTVDVITKRNIAISITGSGTVETDTKEDVTGGSYGSTVEEVCVAEGDFVNAGDVICIFDTSDYKEQIKELKQQISDTEADRKTQNADYDERIQDSKDSIAEQLETAKTNLADAEEDLADAEEELARRQQLLADYIAGGGDEYDEQGARYGAAIDEQESKVRDAEDRVERYEDQIVSLEDQDTSNLEDAKKSYNNQVDDTIDRYEDQIDAIEDQIEEATIRAGISGTITTLNVTKGGTFSGGTVATIESNDHFIIEAQVDEYDIADVAVGMKVLIKTDATREAELEGKITYVATRATNSGSSSLSGLSGLVGSDMSDLTSGSNSSATYLIKIELIEQNERLRLGMNAKVSVVTEESVEAWSVPYDAIHAREDGTTYLDVITGKDEDGNYVTREMDVTIGIQGTYYVEVISDEITDGIQIWIPAAQGTSSISDLLNMMGADAGI